MIRRLWALAALATAAGLAAAVPAAAAPIPQPPAQGVKMGPGPASYGIARVVNDFAADPSGLWYLAGVGSTTSTGLTDYVIRTGTGRYRVWLPGIGEHGAATVSTVDGYSCAVSDVVDITDRDVNGTDVVIACAESGDLTLGPGPGPAADAAFTLTYSYLSTTPPDRLVWAGKPSAYLRALRPLVASYTPDPAYQYNVTGALNAVDRLATGVYRVRLPGLDRPVGPTRVHATAFGDGHARCAAVDDVVRCSGRDGAVDTAFTLTYT
jgi:hypothetical protein